MLFVSGETSSQVLGGIARDNLPVLYKPTIALQNQFQIESMYKFSMRLCRKAGIGPKPNQNPVRHGVLNRQKNLSQLFPKQFSTEKTFLIPMQKEHEQKLTQRSHEQQVSSDKEIFNVAIRRRDLLDLFLWLEKANEFFHQDLHYEGEKKCGAFVKANYKELHRMYYTVVWDWLPEHMQQEIINRES